MKITSSKKGKNRKACSCRKKVCSTLTPYPENHDDEWVEVKHKTVADTDGFNTDYTLWYNPVEGIWECILGDRELYSPLNEYPDAEFDNEDEAEEWFMNYETEDDEEDEDIYNSCNIVKSSADLGQNGYDIVYDTRRGYGETIKFDSNRADVYGNTPVTIRWENGEITKSRSFSLTYVTPDFQHPDFDEYYDFMNSVGRTVEAAEEAGSGSGDDDSDIKEMDQEYTSKDTSINSSKLPAIYNMVDFKEGDVVLDYGCGKFSNAEEYLNSIGATWCGYDPHNRTSAQNQEAIKTIRSNHGANIGLCSNVLNVIKEPEVRLNILQNIKKLMKPTGIVYFTMYEGNRSGYAGATKSGYQQNKKTSEYLEEIQQVFPAAKRKGKLIYCKASGQSVQSAYAPTDLPEEIGPDGLDWSHFWYILETLYTGGYDVLNAGDVLQGLQYMIHMGDHSERLTFMDAYNNTDKDLIADRISEYGWEAPEYNEDGEIIREGRVHSAVQAAANPEQVGDIVEEIREQVYNKVVEMMTGPDYGFTEDEAKQYVRVDATYDDSENPTAAVIEVGAEVSYDSLSEMADACTSIVNTYDSNAYFDLVDPGIMEAYINLNELNKLVSAPVEGAAYNGGSMRSDYNDTYPYDPEDVPEPDFYDTSETYEINLNGVQVDVDEGGIWNYVDESYRFVTEELDLPTNRAKLYYENSVYLDDVNGIVEKIDNLIEPNMPFDAGRYMLAGIVTLVYNIRDLYEGDDGEHYEYAESELNEDESRVDSFICSKVSVESSVSVDSAIGAPVRRVENVVLDRTDNYEYSAYSNGIEKVDKPRPYDDARYYFAQKRTIDNDWNFISPEGKIVDKMPENGDYDVTYFVAKKLEKYNKGIEPKIDRT